MLPVKLCRRATWFTVPEDHLLHTQCIAVESSVRSVCTPTCPHIAKPARSRPKLVWGLADLQLNCSTGRTVRVVLQDHIGRPPPISGWPVAVVLRSGVVPPFSPVADIGEQPTRPTLKNLTPDRDAARPDVQSARAMLNCGGGNGGGQGLPGEGDNDQGFTPTTTASQEGLRAVP